jgi:hypothetical protein
MSQVKVEKIDQIYIGTEFFSYLSEIIHQVDTVF